MRNGLKDIARNSPFLPSFSKGMPGPTRSYVAPIEDQHGFFFRSQVSWAIDRLADPQVEDRSTVVVLFWKKILENDPGWL